MRKPSTRKITTSPATVKAAKTTVAKAATAARATVAEAAKPGPTPEAVANAVAIVTAAAKPAAHITRTAATIARQATNFGNLSDRDTSYLGFYRRLAATQANGVLTVAAIVASGLRPPYIGSNKPHDAGVIVRLTKSGHINSSADGHSLTITALGNGTKAATA